WTRRFRWHRSADRAGHVASQRADVKTSGIRLHSCAMKRLDRTYDQHVGGFAAVVDEQRWRPYAERLRGFGIRPEQVRTILLRATSLRAFFEEGLRATEENRKDTPYVNKLRRELRAVKRASKLVDFFRERSWFFLSMADQLDALLQEYRRGI